MDSQQQNGQYYTERLSDKNISDVAKLHSSVYGEPSAVNFAAKYHTAYTGVNHIGFIAYENPQSPIAFYGVIPCFIQMAADVLLTAQSADTMTHPDYRNRGLFIELALLTFQLCRDSGVKFVFGFPNQNSLPGFVNKLGWQITETMDCFIISSPIYSWVRFFGKIPLMKKAYSNYRDSQLKKYLLPQNGIANSVLADGYGGIYRSHQYNTYKGYGDTHVIKIGDSSLWIKVTTILLIGDVTVKPDDFDDMIYKLKQLANRLGVKEIHFHACPGTTLHHLFALRFKSIPSFPVIFNDFKGDLQTDKIKFTSADIDTF